MILHLCLIISLVNFIDAKKSESPSVIIVGAGAAGIAAATKLIDNGITNVTIFETEDRIGGRIHSVHFGDGIVDLGAQYCHGEKGNIAYELAKDFNILEPGLRGLQNNVYYSNGSRLDGAFIKELKEIYHNYNEIEDTTSNMMKLSVEDVLTFKYNSKLVKKYENDINKIEIVREGLPFLEGYIMVHEGTFSLSKTSAKCDYKKCEGNQALIWKKFGYKTILDIMIRNYPNPANKLPVEEKIYLKTKVKKINWLEDQVKVITSNGTYQADHVIFTPSLEVLKKHISSIFNPRLSLFKHEALTHAGLDGVVKIFVSFNTKWWNDEDRAFSFFWSKHDLHSLAVHVSWITQFRYILKVPDNPKVWVGWLSGDMVPHIEKLSLDKLKRGIEYVLQKFLGKKYNVTDVGEIIRSQWCTNENFGGTYSYTKSGFYNKSLPYQRILAEPQYDLVGKPVLLFAGEATHVSHYSTVHGAIETGYREAQRIMDYYE